MSDMSNDKSAKESYDAREQSRAYLLREKLIRDLEKFFKEYTVQEIGASGLLISTKL